MSKPPKEPREGRSTTRNTANSTANSETEANSKSMDTLTKAVSAIQASIDSFREENRTSIASLQTTLNAFGHHVPLGLNT